MEEDELPSRAIFLEPIMERFTMCFIFDDGAFRHSYLWHNPKKFKLVQKDMFELLVNPARTRRTVLR